MATYVHPTENDVGDGGYAGRAITELKWNATIGKAGNTTPTGVWACGANFVRTGYEYTSHAGFVATFTAGTAIIDGYLVEIDSTQTVTLAASNTYNVFLQLTVDGNDKVDDYQLIKQLTSVTTVPTRAAILAEVPCGATEVTSGSIVDRRIRSPWMHNFTYSGTGAGSGTPHKIFLGFRPSEVFIWHQEGHDEYYHFWSDGTNERYIVWQGTNAPSPWNCTQMSFSTSGSTCIQDYGIAAYGNWDNSGYTHYCMVRP